MTTVGRITHFNKVSGINGLFVGAATAGETQIADGSKIVADSSIFLTTIVAGTAGAYIPVPFDMKMDACYGDISSGALGSAVILQLFANDTAGTALCTAISMGASAATAGSGLVTVGTLSTATLTALSSIHVAVTSGTAATTTVTIVGHRV